MAQASYSPEASRSSSEASRTGSQGTQHKSTSSTDQTASAIGEQVEDTVRRVSEQGRQMGDSVQRVAGNFKGAVDRSVQDQPMMTLVLAAAVGFVLGALWKS
jgi:ElaB/YqjD/DUF883 family membrane-anchored ribosome-binding protein